MLTCKEFLQELSDYLDDAIDGELRSKLEAHVTDCPNCWVIFDTSKKTLRVYKGMEAQAIPADIEQRLLAALEKKIAAKCRPQGA
ncbi:MAG: zf-HC2 domain-containing protein [Acidobacteria bacterium]|nr:zf-HC2 domain-containing protein [Acidobacteriota bacterium]